MARIRGPRKVHCYTTEFKLKAVTLSELDGVQGQDVAEARDIRPIILAREPRRIGPACGGPHRA